ncbi:MAG TPA: acetoacetate decarboxylase family protein [Deltaproteobacteria bacterium]|nr:acetoacetate decarboxylase family protein [Deltaproteobacteria bacterium]HPJ92945.1 acetoacetate decarboxylase family protein [Deltaproteobacteria bacterium]HPR51613.1 acetoacetate decarboxylase family protein [Deltaproteobacteria bacterium]
MKGYSRDQLFTGIEQVDMVIRGHKFKMPVFYRDTCSFSALYPARISAIRKLLPEKRLHPARLLPGVGIISFMAMQYKNTDIQAYNEMIIGTILVNPEFADVTGYNLLSQMVKRSMHFYVLHMPVSTEIARVGGVEGYGFATFLADINFSENAGNIVCKVMDKEQLICTLGASKIETPGSDFMESSLYSFQNGLPQSCRVKSVALQSGISLGPKNVELKLGDTHAIARELSRTLLSRRAIMYVYTPKSQSILLGPENIQPVLLRNAVDSFFPQARLAEKADRRHYAREKVDIQCEIDGSTRGEKSHIRAHVVDLSENGMFVETGIPLDEDTEMRAVVNADKADRTMWVRGKVARIEPHGIAFRFIENIPKDLRGKSSY